MAVPEELRIAVSAWYAKNGDVPCTRFNGKIELMALYHRLFPRKTDDQASTAIKFQVRKVRPVIQPENTPNQFVQKDIGDNTGSSLTEKKNP